MSTMPETARRHLPRHLTQSIAFAEALVMMGVAFLAAPSTADERDGDNRSPEQSREAMESHPELDVSLFAAEPMLHSPADFDVDHRGRVWVGEIVNYRPFRDNQGGREAGDRILVLEDTDGDGHADETTLFYQGQDINSPHGVCVLADPAGDRIEVIVSTATKQGPGPHVARFIDTDGDLKADEKEILFNVICSDKDDP